MTDTYRYSEESAFVNSIIGEGTRLSGEFDLNGLLRIDGEFSGKVRTSGKVLIGKNGVAACKIVAGTVVIGGKVTGDIIATDRIILLSTGELIGNIKAPRVVIEEGVIFDGTCEIIEDKDRLESAKGEFLRVNFTGFEAEEPAGQHDNLVQETQADHNGLQVDLDQTSHITEKQNVI